MDGSMVGVRPCLLSFFLCFFLGSRIHTHKSTSSSVHEGTLPSLAEMEAADQAANRPAGRGTVAAANDQASNAATASDSGATGAGSADGSGGADATVHAAVMAVDQPPLDSTTLTHGHGHSTPHTHRSERAGRHRLKRVEKRLRRKTAAGVCVCVCGGGERVKINLCMFVRSYVLPVALLACC